VVGTVTKHNSSAMNPWQKETLGLKISDIIIWQVKPSRLKASLLLSPLA